VGSDEAARLTLTRVVRVSVALEPASSVLRPGSPVPDLVMMPTTRPRLTVTETDELADALDAAAARWPEVGSRRELLLRLVEQGRIVIEREREMELERRRAAIRRTGGALTGLLSAATWSGSAMTGRCDRPGCQAVDPGSAGSCLPSYPAQERSRARGCPAQPGRAGRRPPRSGALD
jgi:hypothetical protein